MFLVEACEQLFLNNAVIVTWYPGFHTAVKAM